MRNNIELLVLVIMCVSFPLIALSLMSAVICVLSGLSLGISFLVSTLFAVGGGCYLYSILRREAKEFNIELEFNDNEDGIA